MPATASSKGFIFLFALDHFGKTKQKTAQASFETASQRQMCKQPGACSGFGSFLNLWTGFGGSGKVYKTMQRLAGGMTCAARTILREDAP